MRRLWVRLMLAFSLVSMTGVLVVALLANRQLSGNFREYLAVSQIQNSPFIGQLTDYYAAHGTWAGVAETVDSLQGPAVPGRGMHHRMRAFVLADANGRVVYDGSGNAPTAIAAQDLADAAPIIWQEQPIGYLLVQDTSGMGELPMAAQRYLAQVNAALLQAGLIAGLLGVTLGLLITRGLAAPLNRLATAARQVAQGKLNERVPVAGTAEVAEVARAFNEMAGSLEESEQLRRNMVADIAHELRTPLTVVQGNLRAILDGVYPLDMGEIATIYDETVMLNRLVGDLRVLAQAEAGQLALVTRRIEVAPLIEAAVALFATQAAEQQVAVAVDIPGGLPPIQADPDRVRQVLHNLLSNALRYTPPGGTITVRAAPVMGEREQIRRPGEALPVPGVIITVSDAGSGIPPEDLPHVFDRFWRGESSRARDHGGSGLGLAIAKHLVEAQSGQIGAESVTGQGSRFWVAPPAAVG